MTYSKPYAKPTELVAHLKRRGMQFADEDEAVRKLEKIGYYRLAAYWHPFRKDVAISKTEDDDFIDETSFEACHQFYVFDKDLRTLLVDPLERVEIALRARIADVIGSHDPMGHRSTELMQWPRNHSSTHNSWLVKQDKHFSKSRADFATHFREKYAGLHPPIWIAKEVWDWGAMSHLLNGLHPKFRSKVAGYFGYKSGEHLASWTKSLNTLRNDCAHHARVWNRSYTVQPLRPAKGAIPDLDHLHDPTHRALRLYSLAAILVHLCKQAYPRTEVHLRIKALIQDSAPTHPLINAGRTGFPRDWDKMALWS